MSLQVSVPGGPMGLGDSSPLTASVLGCHYNRGTGSREKHWPPGQVSSPPHLPEPRARREKELCRYLPSFTHPVIWVCGGAGCLARRCVVPAPGRARAPCAAPVAPKPLPEVSQGSGLHSRLPGGLRPPGRAGSALQTLGAPGKWSPRSLCSRLLGGATARGSSGGSRSFQGEVRCVQKDPPTHFF